MTARHIVILMHDFPLGGTERIMIGLADRWAADGCAVTFLCGSEAGPARNRVGAGVSVRRIDPEIPRGHFSRFRLGRAMGAVLPGIAADIIVAPGNFHLPVIRALPRDIAVPIVCKLSNPLETRRRGPIAGAVFRLGVRRAALRLDALVAMSPALRDEAARTIDPAKIVVLPEPVLIGTTPRIAAPAGSPLRILCAGRLVPQKRFDLALRTLAAMTGDAVLTIAGDGPERMRLERLAESLGVSHRVRFTGTVAAIDLLLAQADLLLLTSRFEGYPAVLVEALAAGVPVVTTDSSPAVAEIVAHPSFGAVVAANPVQLAQAVVRVGGSPPPDAAACALLIARHDAAQAAAGWLSLLDRIVATHRRG